MGSRTRYFFIGAALVVVVGLGSGLVAYYGGLLPQAGSRGDLAYVSRDVTAVGYANVRDIIDSPFHQRLRQSLPVGEARSQFQAETGVDIERDVDSVVIGATGSGPQDGSLIVLVRGRFDREKLEALATQHGAHTEDYKSFKLLLDANAAPGPAGVPATKGFTFLEPGLVAFGPVSALRGAIDTAGRGEAVTTDDALMGAVNGIQSSGNVWLVARTARLDANASELPDQVRQYLAGVQLIAVGADIDQDLRARVRAEASDAQAAENLRGVLGGLVAAARMFAGQDARLKAALESLQTSGTGTTVELSFVLPAELVDLAQGLPQTRGQRMP